jgi:predicted kinase
VFVKQAFLTVGPQYAGKSTFCEAVVAKHPEIILISRDKIRVEVYGSIWTDPYTTDGSEAMNLLWCRVKEGMKSPDATLILDCWNAGPTIRRQITDTLRQAGATQVEAWYFVTPPQQCVEWLFKRDHPGGNQRYQNYVKLEHQERCLKFHELHKNLRDEGVFDSVRVINPLVDDPEKVFQKSLQSQPVN